MPASPQQTSIPYTSVGMSRLTLDRVDRLRLITGRARSRVMEDLVTAALDAAEANAADGMMTVAALAAVRHQSWDELVHDYAKQYSGKTYPPSIDQIMTAEEAAKITELLDASRPADGEQS